MKTLLVPTGDATRRFYIQIVGNFRVWSPLAGDVTPRLKKTRALLAYLALSPGASADRSELIGLLWSDRDWVHARESLRQCLSDARRCLMSAGGGLVWRDGSRLRLDIRNCAIDMSALNDPDDFVVLARSGSGDVLAGLDGCDPVFDAWLAAERAARRAQVIATLRERLSRAVEAGTSRGLVLRLSAALLRFEPLDEDALGRLTSRTA